MKKEKPLIKKGGTLIGMSRDGKTFYIVENDTHSLCIGATRCGKSRCVVLPSICVQALAGESIICTDPKGELYLYTYPFLERLGYEVITLDFKNPQMSNRYNFLQPVIDAVNEGKTALAITRARDLTASLVHSDTNERVWSDGERAIMACGILAVVFDNKDKPQYQNLTNVYYFLAKMCKAGPKGEMPIVKYLEDIDKYHPVRATIDISEIAPSKMRGSFYTSALVSLELFTVPEIYDMTCTTDFDIYATGKRKRAIFIILPDHKKTFYDIASLFIYQHYQTLVDQADKNGNRLPKRVNFNLDEFGNCAKIPDFDKHITVGGGRGIRYNLFLQDFNQLNEKYGDNVSKTIRSNCETWIYLQSDNPEALRELSEKLGKYTIKSPSLSGNTGGNMSASYNFMGRSLLDIDEIKRIARPYQLVTSRSDPAIMYAPDISQTVFNEMLGLGDEEHNITVMIERQKRREARKEIDVSDIQLWEIWEKYTKGGIDAINEAVFARQLHDKLNFGIEKGSIKLSGMNEIKKIN